jgi:hypothetical protein
LALWERLFVCTENLICIDLSNRLTSAHHDRAAVFRGPDGYLGSRQNP